jgi:hypothetical protein
MLIAQIALGGALAKSGDLQDAQLPEGASAGSKCVDRITPEATPDLTAGYERLAKLTNHVVRHPKRTRFGVVKANTPAGRTVRK